MGPDREIQTLRILKLVTNAAHVQIDECQNQ